MDVLEYWEGFLGDESWTKERMWIHLFSVLDWDREVIHGWMMIDEEEEQLGVGMIHYSFTYNGREMWSESNQSVWWKYSCFLLKRERIENCCPQMKFVHASNVSLSRKLVHVLVPIWLLLPSIHYIFLWSMSLIFCCFNAPFVQFLFTCQLIS